MDGEKLNELAKVLSPEDFGEAVADEVRKDFAARAARQAGVVEPEVEEVEPEVEEPAEVEVEEPADEEADEEAPEVEE